MADLDSGHIFFTTLAPILPGAPEGNPQTSHVQLVRTALAEFPTAHQSPATVDGAFNSPFARNTRTHLARMFVLDDVIYNGRNPMDPLLAKLKGVDQMVPQEVDRLKAPYVVFCADVDAVLEDGDPLPTDLSPAAQQKVRASYARTLWRTMEEELRAVYQHCYGFEGVQSADDFAAFLERCHVETTMPFHDYYIAPPAFHQIPLKPIVTVVAVPLVLSLLGLVLWLLGASQIPILGWHSFATFVFGALGFAALAFAAYRFILWNGARPVPPGTYDDLPSVLKALYIQQKFSEFFIENQGLPPEDLHARFGAFVAEHKPDNRVRMTQKPGVISSADPANVTT